MNREEYSIEDLVLDPEFRKWVLHPSPETKAIWDEFLKKYPEKQEAIYKARTIVLNFSKRDYPWTEEKEDLLWKGLLQRMESVQVEEKKSPIIPITSRIGLNPKDKGYLAPRSRKKKFTLLGLTTLLLFLGGLVYFGIFEISSPPEEPVALEWVEHLVPKGQKSIFRLTDGTRITANSGTRIRHIRDFEKNQRDLYLEGEAYFEVAKDPTRPFSVYADSLVTQAIGTSFLIKAVKDRPVEVSLLEGIVEVKDPHQSKSLIPGQQAYYDESTQEIHLQDFDEEEVMAWTKKIIFLKDKELTEVFEILENWYGVDIQVTNMPKKSLTVNGKYQDQTLTNVLRGLSYTARFRFSVEDKVVTIKF